MKHAIPAPVTTVRGMIHTTTASAELGERHLRRIALPRRGSGAVSQPTGLSVGQTKVPAGAGKSTGGNGDFVLVWMKFFRMDDMKFCQYGVYMNENSPLFSDFSLLF